MAPLQHDRSKTRVVRYEFIDSRVEFVQFGQNVSCFVSQLGRDTIHAHGSDEFNRIVAEIDATGAQPALFLEY